LLKCGVTIIVATTGAVPGFVAENEGILPIPFAVNPIDGWSFVQVYVVTPPVLTVAKATVVVLSPLQTTSLAGCSTSAVGFTVTVRLKEVPVHPFTLGVIIYTTSIGDVVVLMSVSVMVAVMPDPNGLLIPPTTALVQANVAVLLVLVAV
jgi:hypothetical protein